MYGWAKDVIRIILHLIRHSLGRHLPDCKSSEAKFAPPRIPSNPYLSSKSVVQFHTIDCAPSFFFDYVPALPVRIRNCET